MLLNAHFMKSTDKRREKNVFSLKVDLSVIFFLSETKRFLCCQLFIKPLDILITVADSYRFILLKGLSREIYTLDLWLQYSSAVVWTVVRAWQDETWLVLSDKMNSAGSLYILYVPAPVDFQHAASCKTAMAPSTQSSTEAKCFLSCSERFWSLCCFSAKANAADTVQVSAALHCANSARKCFFYHVNAKSLSFQLKKRDLLLPVGVTAHQQLSSADESCTTKSFLL